MTNDLIEQTADAIATSLRLKLSQRPGLALVLRMLVQEATGSGSQGEGQRFQAALEPLPDSVAQLTAEGRSEGRATWQPIDVYLHEFDRHFANDSPLAAREYFADTIRLLLNRSTWQPISSAPKDKTWFLGWNSDCGVFVWRDGPGLLTGEDPAPTHWMPLPDPPSASGEDQ